MVDLQQALLFLPPFVSIYVTACELTGAEILSFPPRGSACSPEPDPREHSVAV